jgi:Uma2 family endonuclease
MHEIVLPETKPALEWINNRVVQKVSPKRKHSLAQAEFLVALREWSRRERRGRALPEWEFRLAPPGEIRRPLVPDVAYLSYARLPRENETEADIPRIAPEAVVEVLSSGDPHRDVEEKVRVYFASGTLVVFLVDTKHQTVTVRDAAGSETIDFNGIVSHSSLPGFAMPARALFEEP